MANFMLIALHFLTTALVIYSTVIAVSSEHGVSWPVMARALCQGSTAECMMGNMELEMGLEINRRMLASASFISYDALKPNNVPCSRRGDSYYNCRPGAEANPYNRSCTVITRCR